MPAHWVICVVIEQRPQKRRTGSDRLRGFIHQVRDQGVAQIPPRAHDVGNGRILVGFARLCAVITEVRGKCPRLRPSHVEVVIRPVIHEIMDTMKPRHIMAPIGETRQAQVQTAADGSGQPIPTAGAVAAPVHGVALRAGPAGARPDDALAGHLLRDFKGCFLI